MTHVQNWVWFYKHVILKVHTNGKLLHKNQHPTSHLDTRIASDVSLLYMMVWEILVWPGERNRSA